MSWMNTSNPLFCRGGSKWKFWQNDPVLNNYVAGIWCERATGDGLFRWRKCWIKDSYFGQKCQFQIKMPCWNCFLWMHHFSFQKMLTDGLESCGILVDYSDVFITRLDFHSDGTHSLQSIHWWASDAMLNFAFYVSMKKNSSTSWVAWGLVH